jgi:hypothetical protein
LPAGWSKGCRIKGKTMRATTAALAVVLLASAGTAPARDREPIPSEMAFSPDLAGQWRDETDWGTVTLRPTADGLGFEGTYSGTYGKDVGRLSLSFSQRSGAFEGTWSEGTYRFGRLSVRLARSRTLVQGSYSADARCEHQPGVPARKDFELKRVGK